MTDTVENLIIDLVEWVGRKERTYRETFSRSHDAVIRVYDQAGNVIETREHKGEFKEP